MGAEPQRAAGSAAEAAGRDGAECAQETGGGGEGQGRSGMSFFLLAGKGGLSRIAQAYCEGIRLGRK